MKEVNNLKVEIKYCPNCSKPLINNKKLAQGVKECGVCKTRFFILVTSINT